MASFVSPDPAAPAHASSRFRIDRIDIAWALGLCAALIAIKWLLIVVPYQGLSITDEIVYHRLTETLSRFEMLSSAQYPPLYPMLLVPGFWFAGGSLKALAALGVVFSALSVVPVFAFARAVLPRAGAVMATIATCLLPWHYIVPRTFLSENIFIGLVILAGLMAMWAPKRGRWWWDAGFGLVLGILYLTRYISLVLIPVLIIVWCLREWGQHVGDDDVHSPRARLARFGLVLTVAAATFGWWVLGQASVPDTSASDALGFVITSRTNPDQLTLGRLWLYVRWYAAYFVLLAVPVLGLVLQSFRQAAAEWTANRYPTLYVRFVSFAVLIGGALFVAVSRHSWRAFYNYPDPVRIMGRYLIVLGPILLIVGMAALWRLSDHPFKSRWSAAVWMLGVPGALAFVAHQVVVGDWLLAFNVRQITDRGSVDGFATYLLGTAFWPLAAASLATAAGIAIWRQQWRWAPAAVFVVVAAYLVWPAPAYLAHIRGYQEAAFHGARVTEAFANVDPGSEHPVVAVSESVMLASELLRKLGPAPGEAAFTTTMRINMHVRGQGGKVISASVAPGPGEATSPDYLLITTAELEPHAEKIATWQRGGESYTLVGVEY